MPLFENDEIIPVAIYDGTGRTVRLPASVARALNLPKAEGADPMSQVDYGNSAGDGPAWGYREDGSARPEIHVTQPSIAPAAPMTREQTRLASNLGPRSTGVLNLQQATGPTGTIGQIGQAAPQFTAPEITAEQAAAIDAPQAAPVETPAPPATTDTLRAAGPAGVLNQQTQALDAEAKAGEKLAETEAQRDLAVADAYTKRNDQIDQQIAARAKAAEDQAKAIDAKMVDYDAAVKKYADTKVDRSIDHPILAAISLALGAIGGAIKNDGSNPALDILFKNIDRKVAAQMADQAKLRDVAGSKRGDIDLLRQRANDRNAQYNLSIAGETEKAARQIEAIAARSQSAEVKNRAAIAAAQLRQKVAAATGDAVGAQMAKDERDRAFEEQQRQAKVGEANQRAHLGIAYANQKLNERQFEWTKEYQSGQLANEAAKVAATGNVKAAENLRELGVAAPPQAVQDADGNVTIKRDGVLMQADGKTPFEAPTKEEAISLRKKVGAANNLIQILDEVRSIRERVGGESSWGNSDDYQRLQVLKNNLVIIKKSGTEGMSSEEDMNKLIASLGAKDPTSFRAQSAGLEEGRNQVIKQINSDLHSQYGYQGKDLEWADPVKAGGPTKTPDDAAFQKVISDPTRDGTNLAAEFGFDPAKTDSREKTRQAFLDADRMTPTQRKTLDNFAAAATDPSITEQQREKAREYLYNATQAKTASDGVKEYAQTLLAGTVTSNIQTSPDEAGPATSTARDSSKGVGPSTLSEQVENDKLNANVAQTLPLQRIVQGAIAKDEISINELRRRAGSGDRAAQTAYHRDYLPTVKK